MVCCSYPLKAMHILLTGAWVALYVCARPTVGRWSLSEEESATSCMSSLSTPTLRLVSSFIHRSSHSTIHAQLWLAPVRSYSFVITLHSPSQVPTSATGKQILMETAATSVSRPQTHGGCVAVRMAWSCCPTSRRVWTTLPTSPPHCSVEPTPSPVATANVSQTATDAMVLMIAMTTVTNSTVELTVMLFLCL